MDPWFNKRLCDRCEVRVATGPGLEDYGAYVKEYV